jgi:conjugative transfer signal peptidase TraF
VEQQDEEEGAVEAVRKAMGQSGSVVEQGKGSVTLRYGLCPFRCDLRLPARNGRITWRALRNVMRIMRRNVPARGDDGFSQWWRRQFGGPVAGLTFTVIAAALLIIAAGRLHLRITLTDSAVAAGIYRISEASPGRGALVAACLPSVIARQGLARGYLQKGDCPAGAEPVAKVIGALAGDELQIEPGFVAVNGVKFPNSQTATHDSAGRPLMHVPSGAYRVSADQVWLFGFNNVRSWDARYFGPVPAANVRGVLRPLVTW